MKESLENEFARLDKDKLTPWIFMTTDHGLDVTALDGSKVRYRGIEFSGTARLVFWDRFSVPFLKDIISRGFAETREFCEQHGIAAAPALDETAELLRDGVDRTFKRMVDIDRRLRGKGTPTSVEPYNPSTETAKALSFLDERLEDEKLLVPKQRSRFNKFYEEQKFWIWAIGALIALAGIMAKFIG